MMTQRRRGNESWEHGGLELREKVVDIRRVAKVVKGGRHLSFNAAVVVGDGSGRVGFGLGKAVAVPDAVRKGTAIARKHMIVVPMKGSTIPHVVLSKFGACQVLMKPAPPGVGIIAGGGVRAVMEMAGIKDIVTKSLGSRNPVNLVQATVQGLRQLRDPEEDRARRKPGTSGPPVAKERTEMGGGGEARE